MSSEETEHLNDPDFLSDSASKFTPRDARSLRMRFRSAGNVGEVIPQIMLINRGIYTTFLLANSDTST